MTTFEAYRARWVVPVDSRPIEQGVIVVRDGRIVSVAERWSHGAIDLGDVALIPGLVNAHTHLEFSDRTEPLPATASFPDWLERVIAERRGRTTGPSAAIRQGLREAILSGTTLLGEIATQGWTAADYAGDEVPRTVVFQELLALDPERVRPLVEQAAAHVAATTADGAELPYVPGLSLHAPYTVHPELFRQTCALVGERLPIPLAMHVAEAAEERQLLADDAGPFREFLERVGVWRPGLFGGRDLGALLEGLLDRARPLIIHGNHLTSAELRRLAQHPHATLVYCPRTHAAFGHPPHPWQTLLMLGGSVAIGTDSRASNPDLSLWRELQWLAERTADVSHHTLLKLGTWQGARALGQGQECGTLSAGKRADLAVVELRDPAFRDPVYDLLAPGNLIAGVMLGGRWVSTPAGLC